MSWHYQARKRVISGEPVVDIVEAYPSIKGWTIDGIGAQSDSKRGLIKVLEMMLHDCKKYPVLNDEEES